MYNLYHIVMADNTVTFLNRRTMVEFITGMEPGTFVVQISIASRPEFEAIKKLRTPKNDPKDAEVTI